MINFDSLTTEELLRWRDADLENPECRAIIKTLFSKLNDLADVEERRQQELDLFIERIQHYQDILDNNDFDCCELRRTFQKDIEQLTN
tara:strand:- start:8132 stop:8395 length:264 start_codon:yes stop_codon:yes gene_type:complete